MKYIVKYLKPYWLGVLLVITLLFVQSSTELNLPNYMSNIVNVGLQQSGIEHSSPDAISQEALDFIKNFMSGDEISLVDKYYKLANSEDVADRYSSYTNGNIYLKSLDISETDNTALDKAFSYASLTSLTLVQDIAASNPMPTPNEATSKDTSGDEIPEVTMDMLYQLSPLLSMMPADKVEGMITITRDLDSIVASQTGIVFTEAYYKELGVDTSNMQQDYIMNTGFIMLAIALLGGIATILVSLINSIIAGRVARTLREKIFNKVNSFSHQEFDTFSTSSLITRSTNDVMQIQGLCVMGIRFIFYSPIMLIGGVYMALNKSLSMAWIIALGCILIIGFISIIMRFVMPKFKIMQSLIDRINLVAREILTGLMVIRAFGTANHESKRFEVANETYAKNNLFVNKTMALLFPFMSFIMNITSILIVWFGAKEISNSNIQVGDMMAFIQYSMQIIMSFLMIGMLFVFIPRAIVSAGRINDILTTEPVIVDPIKSQVIDALKKGIVEFKDVSFRYNGANEDAIVNINFTASPGQTVAFIGPTGSGKTTILNLIPRFYDVSSGEVLVAGVNVKNLAKRNLRSQIGYIPQKSLLMSGTIESNIKYGKEDISDDTMHLAAEISQSKEFISDKEDGYNTHVSQGGTNVSGGQRQRLSIARALAISPDIYLFDDSFSALDYKTDITLRSALKDNIKAATIIIIAQRVGTILDADIIHVLDDGKIIASGTHKELLKSCDTYYEIASSQLSKEELAYE